MNKNYDICILGAGIMGVTLASKLAKNTDLKVCVIESGPNVGLVQTNKNSGVVHSGIYYKNTQNILGFCLYGKQRVIDYCLKYDLPIKLTGKSIKFNDSNKDELIKRCEDYNLDYSIKNNFIKLSEVCLVDYLKITQHQYENCKDKVDFYFNTKISEITTNKIFCENFTLDYNFLVNLTGVKANDIYREMSNDNSYTVCEILGRYHEFNIQHDNMVYNGPDKKLPFLGVHITPTFKKTIKLGPDAFPIIISKNISNNVKDVLMRFKFYMNNFNYFNKNLFNKSPQKMIEQSKQLEDLNIDMNSYVGQTFGVRSVLLNSKCEVEKNFIFKKYKNSIHLLNSHSPAATCTFAISDYIMNEIIK